MARGEFGERPVRRGHLVLRPRPLVCGEQVAQRDRSGRRARASRRSGRAFLHDPLVAEFSGDIFSTGSSKRSLAVVGEHRDADGGDRLASIEAIQKDVVRLHLPARSRDRSPTPTARECEHAVPIRDEQDGAGDFTLGRRRAAGSWGRAANLSCAKPTATGTRRRREEEETSGGFHELGDLRFRS